MNKDIKALWLASLRSGQYKQGVRLLRSPAEEFCCLGVLCAIHRDHAPEGERGRWCRTDDNYVYMSMGGMPPSVVTRWAELPDRDATTLATMNDSGKTFEEIATYIEEKM